MCSRSQNKWTYSKWNPSQFLCSKTEFVAALCWQLLHLHAQMAIHHPVWATAVLRSKRWRCHFTISISSRQSNSASLSLFPAIVSKTRLLFEIHCLANWLKISDGMVAKGVALTQLKSHKGFGLFNLWIVNKKWKCWHLTGCTGGHLLRNLRAVDLFFLRPQEDIHF